jgi:hypothetical protein
MAVASAFRDRSSVCVRGVQTLIERGNQLLAVRTPTKQKLRACTTKRATAVARDAAATSKNPNFLIEENAKSCGEEEEEDEDDVCELCAVLLGPENQAHIASCDPVHSVCRAVRVCKECGDGDICGTCTVNFYECALADVTNTARRY